MSKIIHSPYHAGLRKEGRRVVRRLRRKGILKPWECRLSRVVPTFSITGTDPDAADWEMMVAAVKGGTIRGGRPPSTPLERYTATNKRLIDNCGGACGTLKIEGPCSVGVVSRHDSILVGRHSRWHVSLTHWPLALGVLLEHRCWFTRAWVELAFNSSNARLIVEWEKP